MSTIKLDRHTAAFIKQTMRKMLMGDNFTGSEGERKEFPFTNLTDQIFAHGFSGRPVVDVLDTAGNSITVPVTVTATDVRIRASPPISGTLICLYSADQSASGAYREFAFTGGSTSLSFQHNLGLLPLAAVLDADGNIIRVRVRATASQVTIEANTALPQGRLLLYATSAGNLNLTLADDTDC